MKTYKHLYESIISFDNLHTAYRKARRLKRYREEVLLFSYRLEEALLSLRQELAEGNYAHGGYREFLVHDSKRRLIRAAPFRDRVVHKAVCLQLEPIFERYFIHDSYACRKQKGVHAAVRQLELFLQKIGGGGVL